MQDRRQKLTVRDLINRLSVDDKTSEPYYKQLIRHIEHLIISGQASHGLGLPSERDLAEALKLSRTTVRRCYDELRKAGLLSANGRGGTSVNHPQTKRVPLGKLKSFADEMQEVGMSASAILESHEVISDRTIASVFQRPSNAKFLRMVRIKLANGLPMAREIAWYDLSVAPALTACNPDSSIHAFLQERCDIRLSYAEQSMESMLSSELESTTFGFTHPSPCLFLKRSTYSTENKLVEYVETTFRGDAYIYRVKLDV